jgi:spermidine synthase
MISRQPVPQFSDTRAVGRAALGIFLPILLLFFFSGASGLVYQVLWIRVLTRIFGSTTFAVSALLAAFMAGLGCGSYLASRYLRHVRQPLRWFGACEMGIGLYALALNEFLPSIQELFLAVLSRWGLAAQVLLSFVLLVPPTTLMGASLPLLVKQTIASMRSMGLRTGLLYAINTLGAAAGCFAAGFYAVEHWGMKATTETAALSNVLVGIAGIGLSFLLRETSLPAGESEEAQTGASPRALPWAIAAFTASGFAAIGLEVVWTRLFTLVLKGYSYSFTSMLTVVLLGIAFGSLAFAPRADRSRDLESLFGVLQMAIGISVVGLTSLLVFAEASQVYFLYLFGYDWFGYTMMKFLVSLVILGIPTFLFGAQFPVVSRIATESARRAGDRVALLYAANVAGSIAGALLTGFALIPLLGSHASLRLLAAAMMVSGALLFVRREFSPASRRSLVAAGGIAVFIGVMVATPADLSLRIHESWLAPGEHTSYYDEGATATVFVAKHSQEVENDARILVNGSSASNSTHYGLTVNRIQGSIPFLFERMPRKVFATCFGTGITFGTVGQFDVAMDGVEISSEVIDAAGEFARLNYDARGNPRIRIHIDDGRNFLLKSRERYDAITMEPMPPAIAGVSDLYTREFYGLCRERLAPGGVMSQWVPLYFLTLEDVQMLYRTFAESFPHVLVFHHMYDTFLVGSDQPLVLDPEAFENRLTSGNLRRDLEKIGLGTLPEIYGTFLMDRDAALRFSAGAPIVTDDRPLVEYTGPKAVDISTTPTNYLELVKFSTPITEVLDKERVSPELLRSLGERFRLKKEEWDVTRERFQQRQSSQR